MLQSSSSRMRVINHNWSATKQRPHPQSVAEISGRSKYRRTPQDSTGHRRTAQDTTSSSSSHHMEKTEAGLCIREIMTKYTLYYTKYYTIILRFPMPWRSAL